MSNAGKWESWYAGVHDRRPYGDTITYEVGAAFLSDCATVEDWGCGAGWMRQFVPAARYVGVDGTHSAFVDRVSDLETYTSDVDGIFMRHVLEHNYGWQAILKNALSSFRRRFVLVTFTPHGETTHEITFLSDPGVPDISFAKNDLTRHFDGLAWREETYWTDTQYGTETVFFVERPQRRVPPAPVVYPWGRIEDVEGEPEVLDDVRLFGVLGTWNEEDVVAACVRNALTQGCERVFLVDNASDDDTVANALAAGATLDRRYSSRRYDESLRVQLMQDVVESVSRDCGAQHVWWLWLDADEFCHGRAGLTIRQQLEALDRRYRVVGARYLNHYPAGSPAYRPGAHPLDYQRLAEEMVYSFCAAGHRKHPLQRWDREGVPVQSGLGFHEAYASVELVEPREAVILHHFPFRGEAATRARMAKLCEIDDRKGEPRAPTDHNSADHIWPRFESLDAVYRQDWANVVDFMSGTKGVHLRPWTEIVGTEDAVVAPLLV
jgi:hypothetical protein